jgi:hypothetical protein
MRIHVLPPMSTVAICLGMSMLRALAGLLSPTQPKEVGFWRELDSPLAGFDHRPHPSALVDPRWSPAERAKVVAYLRSGRVRERYFGHSHCRLCSLAENGCADLTDGVWVWPDGFVHYVQAHFVKPPQAFVDHVLRGRTSSSA